MGKTSKGKRKHRREVLSKIHPQQAKAPPPDPSNLQRLPVSYQEINDYYQPFPESRPFDLRKETFLRIEAITGRPLICYVAKTANVAPGLPTAIDDSDLIGFTDFGPFCCWKQRRRFDRKQWRIGRSGGENRSTSS